MTTVSKYDCTYKQDYGAGTINKSVCSDCRAEYRALNQHFVSMQEKANYQICMDLVDMVSQLAYNTLVCQYKCVKVTIRHAERQLIRNQRVRIRVDCISFAWIL